MKNMTASLLACLFASLPVTAEIYKCTDANGDIHYGDTPCQGESTVFTPRTGSKVDENIEERKEKTERLLRAYREEHAEKQQLASELKAAKEQRTKNCSRAKKRYLQLSGARRFYRIDRDGNYIDYTDDERLAYIAREKAAIETWCYP